MTRIASCFEIYGSLQASSSTSLPSTTLPLLSSTSSLCHQLHLRNHHHCRHPPMISGGWLPRHQGVRHCQSHCGSLCRLWGPRTPKVVHQTITNTIINSDKKNHQQGGRAPKDWGGARLQRDGRQGAELAYLHIKDHPRWLWWWWWFSYQGSSQAMRVVFFYQCASKGIVKKERLSHWKYDPHLTECTHKLWSEINLHSILESCCNHQIWDH